MAYNVNDLTNLGHLKTLAERLKAEGGELNKIDSIKVNGVAQAITDKAVNITVPTDSQIATKIQEAIAKSGHAAFEKADTVPDPSTAKENVLYLVMNATTKHYDIYALVSGKMELLDDTTVDLSNYVEKETGKGLSTNDYTTEEKNKLAGLSNYVHPAYTAKASGFYKITVDATGHVSAVTAVTKADITGLGIPGQDTTYKEATASAAGLMSAADKTKLDDMETATDAEVTEMINEVFGASA